MAVKIKLKRVGKIHAPQYRVIVADSRKRRDGRAIEEIGIYQPMQDPSLIQIDSARAQHWLSVGAQPTDPVLALLKITGDWQKFRGLPGAEGTLRVAAPKPSKTIAYELATADAAKETKVAAPKPADAKTETAEKAEKAEKADKAEETIVEKVVEAVEDAAEAVVEVVTDVVEAVEHAIESVLPGGHKDEPAAGSTEKSEG